MSCRPDLLEAHVRGELCAAQSAQVAEHLDACTACHEELSWLRTEHRLLAERARHLTPPYLQLANLRAGVDARISQRAREHRRIRFARGGGAVLSAFAAALIAFVIASVPERGGQAELSWLAPETCSSMERGGTGSDLVALCVAASGGHERWAAVENVFDACLVATPHALPGVGMCH